MRGEGAQGSDFAQERRRELVERFDTELQAGEALEQIARAKRRRGYVDL